MRQLADAVRRPAALTPGEPALIFLGDGETESDRIGFGELDRRARVLAASLVAAGAQGRPVLLLQAPGVAFAAGFWACVYAGAVAVPAPAHSRGEGWRRLLAVAEDSAAAAVLAAPADALSRAELGHLPWIVADGAGGGEALDEPVRRAPDDIVLLQYTSGSAASPKGVAISHRALCANLEMVRHGLGLNDASVVFSWLPLFHDMGLIGAFLGAAYVGRPCVLAPAVSFMQKPERWLKAISRYRATYSGAPNFAFELCARRAGRMDLEALDLSCWESAFCGAEPIRAATLARFAAAFAPAGFRASALRPGYGLAEATLIVSGGPAGGLRTLDAPGRPPLVGCGAPVPGMTLAIVDPETGLRARDGAEGEVWAAGPNLAEGYWRRPEETAASFGARLDGSDLAYLRTGDLGLLSKGELYVTGRIKDLLIHRGANLHPSDLEQAVGDSHPGFSGAAAAFQLADGEVVVVHEVERGLDAEAGQQMVEAAVRAAAQTFGVRLHDLVLVRRRGVPATTSGKVRRAACRDLYLAGALRTAASLEGNRLLGRWSVAAGTAG